MDKFTIIVEFNMKVKVSVAQSCLTLCNPMNCSLCPWNYPGKDIGVGNLSFLQGIFPTQESNLAGRLTASSA